MFITVTPVKIPLETKGSSRNPVGFYPDHLSSHNCKMTDFKEPRMKYFIYLYSYFCHLMSAFLIGLQVILLRVRQYSSQDGISINNKIKFGLYNQPEV